MNKNDIQNKRKTCGELTLDAFLKLPRRAQFLFFEDMENYDMSEYDKNPYIKYSFNSAFFTEECKSPIEQILLFALCSKGLDYNFIPTFECQYEIVSAKGVRYYSDIAIISTDEDDGENVIVLVECDGHEFHAKTKAQVRRDNERDYNLKMSGYDVLHYSGSQIYEDPFKCAKEILDYCEAKVNKGYGHKMD